jgi:hypothetical protein
MINRFGPGKLILLLLILCVAAFAAFDRYNTMLQSKFGRPLVTYALGLAFFLAFLTYYRLLQEYSSSREEGPTLSKRQQCEVTELHNAAAPTVRRGHEVMQFKIAPWPWITQVGAVLRFVSGLALFLGY